MTKFKMNIIKVTIIIFICLVLWNLFNLSTTSIGALKAVEKGNKINIIDEYTVDKKVSFIIYQDDYQNYYVAKLNSLFGSIYSVVENINVQATSVATDLEHVALYAGGYYINYILVNDDNIKYIAIGNIQDIKEYNGNIYDLLDFKNRYRDKVIIKKIMDGSTVCFWGKEETGSPLNSGLVTAFNRDGEEMYSEIVY